jgi:hypothetical protein
MAQKGLRIAFPFLIAATFSITCLALMGSKEAKTTKVPLSESQSKVTYAEHVKPILDRACIGCHRPGEVAPFSLIGYENAKKWAPMIDLITKTKKMPPWKAVKGYNEFLDENRLSESELDTLHRWNEANAPRGDAKKEPKTPEFPKGPWPLGEPDLVLTPDTAYKLDAEGADVYRHFVLKTKFTDTKWVKAMAVSPGNKLVVHHVIAYLDEKGKSHQLSGKDGQAGYNTFGGPGFVPDGSLGGWAPGLNVQYTPEGVAFELKPGTTVVMEVHYHKTGKPETDQTKLGIYFAKEPVVQTMALAWLAKPNIRIQSGDGNSVQTMAYPVPADVTVYNAMPHMHLLAKSMKAEVEFPDGTKKPMVYVEDWDFNWQMSYMFKEPMKIPKGSTIRITSVYDNSASNPNNPSNPPKNVFWGEQTTDEMMLLICGYTVDGVKAPRRRMLGFGDGG